MRSNQCDSSICVMSSAKISPNYSKGLKFQVISESRLKVILRFILIFVKHFIPTEYELKNELKTLVDLN